MIALAALLLVAAPQESVGKRLDASSARFLGKPYLTSPLGEGKGKDPDPLIRYDAFDCVTFVETAMAVTLAPQPDQVLPTLSRIRYRTEPAYDERNHLMEADWIPNNIKKGFIADVTKDYGGADAVVVTKTYSPETWASESAKGLGLPVDHQAKGTFAISMIPLAKFVAKAAAIPDGTIVVVVRQDQPEMVTRISHLGFLFHGPKGPFIRHAGLGPKKVVDEPLASFVGRHAEFKKWPVEGFSLYAVRQP